MQKKKAKQPQQNTYVLDFFHEHDALRPVHPWVSARKQTKVSARLDAFQRQRFAALQSVPQPQLIFDSMFAMRLSAADMGPGWSLNHDPDKTHFCHHPSRGPGLATMLQTTSWRRDGTYTSRLRETHMLFASSAEARNQAAHWMSDIGRVCDAVTDGGPYVGPSGRVWARTRGSASGAIQVQTYYSFTIGCVNVSLAFDCTRYLSEQSPVADMHRLVRVARDRVLALGTRMRSSRTTARVHFAPCDAKDCVKISDKQRCGSCRVVSYCGTSCQKRSWSGHKVVCGM
jgi:hypothetical protein